MKPTDGIVASPTSPGSTDNLVHVVLHALDQYGNVATTESRSVTVHVSGFAFVVGGVYLVPFVNGVASFDMGDHTPETVTISLVDSQGSGLNVASTQAVIIVPGLNSDSFLVCSHSMAVIVNGVE